MKKQLNHILVLFYAFICIYIGGHFKIGSFQTWSFHDIALYTIYPQPHVPHPLPPPHTWGWGGWGYVFGWRSTFYYLRVFSGRFPWTPPPAGPVLPCCCGSPGWHPMARGLSTASNSETGRPNLEVKIMYSVDYNIQFPGPGGHKSEN